VVVFTAVALVRLNVSDELRRGFSVVGRIADLRLMIDLIVTDDPSVMVRDRDLRTVNGN
jgi:hypothetical protein